VQARARLALLAFLGIGALFAYFGQTYQTGADPWQLFALWAVLGLPLCGATRSDVLWAPWALVVMTAISLWVYAHTGHRWFSEAGSLSTYGVAWGASVLVLAALSPLFTAQTGAKAWSLRTAATLAVVMWTSTGLTGLFSHTQIAPHYALGLLLLAGTALAFSTRRCFDVFVLSAIALGLNVLLVGGLARWFLESAKGNPIGVFLLLGLMAAGLLAASVSLVMRVARQHADTGAMA
jgi:uncharacterized membrane protein